MEKKYRIYAALALFTLKAMLASVMLHWQLDLNWIPRFLTEKKAYGVIALVDVVITFYVISCHKLKARFVFSGLIMLLIANVLILSAAFLPLAGSGKVSIFSSLIGSIKAGALFYVVTSISAVAYLMLGANMARREAEFLNGWQKPFEYAFIAYGSLTLIYFLDLARLACLLGIQILGALWLSNVFIKQHGWQVLNEGRIKALLSGALGGPVLLVMLSYLWPVLTHWEEAAEFAEDLAQAVTETEITRPKQVDGETPETIGFVPGGFQKKGSRIIADDAWLLPDNEWAVISHRTLYKTRDWDTWHQIYEFYQPVSAIRFSSDGKRGWAKSGYGEISITFDGGLTWLTVNTTEIYSALTGKRYNEGFLDIDSDIYMNPETGFGAFTLKCQYLYTHNFGESWKIEKLVDAKGKKICVDDSPLAMNLDRSLAVGSVLGSEILYQLNHDQSYWEPVCGLDDGGFLMGHPYCGSKADLTDQQKLFISELENHYALLVENNYPYDLFRMISDDAFHPVEELGYPAYESAGTHFVSSMGNIIATDNNGESWQILQNHFEFEKLIPVDDQKAYALDEYRLWFTANRGRTWDPVDTLGNKVRDLVFSPVNDLLWVLTVNHLMALDIKEQTVTRALDFPAIKYTHMGRNAGSSALWLFSAADRFGLVSFDNGSAWYALYTEPGLDENGAVSALNITAMYCESAETGCHVALDNGEIAVYGLSANDELIRQRELALSDEVIGSIYDYSLLGLVATENGQKIALVMAGGNDAYLSPDAGSSWQRISFYNNDSREEMDFSDQGNLLVVKGEDSMTYSSDYGATWKIFNPGDDWGDYDMRLCSAADGRHIYIYSSTDLSFSEDGGNTWKNDGSGSRTGFYCGFGNHYLWLKHHDMHVYHKAEG